MRIRLSQGLGLGARFDALVISDDYLRGVHHLDTIPFSSDSPDMYTFYDTDMYTCGRKYL